MSLRDQVLKKAHECKDYSSYAKYAKDLVNEPMNKFSENPVPSSIKFEGVFKKFFKNRTHKNARTPINFELWSNWSQTKRSAEAYPDSMVYLQYAKHLDSITSQDLLTETEGNDYLDLLRPILDRIIGKVGKNYSKMVMNYHNLLLDQKVSTSACKENNTHKGGAEGLLISVALFNYFSRGSEHQLIPNGLAENQCSCDLQNEGICCMQARYERKRLGEGKMEYIKTISNQDLGPFLDPNSHTRLKNSKTAEEIQKNSNFLSERPWYPTDVFKSPSKTWEKKAHQDYKKDRTLYNGANVFDLRQFRYEPNESELDTYVLQALVSGTDQLGFNDYVTSRLIAPLIICEKEMISMTIKKNGNLVKSLNGIYSKINNDPCFITTSYASGAYVLQHELSSLIDGELDFFLTHDKESLDTIVHALKEPQKIRIITKGSALPYFLTKGLQRLIHGALREEKGFGLIGRSITPLDFEGLMDEHLRVHGTSEGWTWFSGDYQSSTDALSNGLSKKILTYLIDGMSPKDNPNQIKRSKSFLNLSMSTLFGQTVHYERLHVAQEDQNNLSKEEIAFHHKNDEDFDVFVEYAEKLCKERGNNTFKLYQSMVHKSISVTQTNGQLMGSLLSFPILCLVNYALYLKTTQKDRGVPIGSNSESKANVLINGDDILYLANIGNKTASDHQTNGIRLGLAMSPGKSFLSTTFAQVNSMNCYFPLGEKGWKTGLMIRPFPTGLFFGKQKSMGRVTGSKDEHEEDLIKRRPFAGTMDSIFRSPMDAKLKARLFCSYLRINKEDIETEKKNRNLFLPQSLGGMGVKPIKHFSYDVYPHQYEVAIHKLTDIRYSLRNTGIKVIPKRGDGPLAGIDKELPTKIQTNVGESETLNGAMSLLVEKKEPFEADMKINRTKEEFKIKNDDTEDIILAKKEAQASWNKIYLSLKKKYSITLGIKQFAYGFSLVKPLTRETWDIDREVDTEWIYENLDPLLKVTVPEILKQDIKLKNGKVIKMNWNAPNFAVITKDRNTHLELRKAMSDWALSEKESFVAPLLKPNFEMAIGRKSRWVQVYTRPFSLSEYTCQETDTTGPNETVPLELRNAIQVQLTNNLYPKCQRVEIKDRDEARKLSFKRQLNMFLTRRGIREDQVEDLERLAPYPGGLEVLPSTTDHMSAI